MKIILENELERYAWGVMMEAHEGWEKNSGSSLHECMERYFYDIYKEETGEAIKKEVERRLRDEFGEEFFVSEDDYVKSGLGAYGDEELADEEKQELERQLREEYREIHKDISGEREYLPDDMKHKLMQIYYNFFNSPEKLTVIYNGEGIQGASEE